MEAEAPYHCIHCGHIVDPCFDLKTSKFEYWKHYTDHGDDKCKCTNPEPPAGTRFLKPNGEVVIDFGTGSEDEREKMLDAFREEWR